MSAIKVPVGWIPGDDPLLGLHLQTATLSLCPHMSRERERESERALVSLFLRGHSSLMGASRPWLL